MLPTAEWWDRLLVPGVWCQQAELVSTDGRLDDGARFCSRVPQFIAGSIIREPLLHRLFGRKCLSVGFAEVIATLSPSCSEIFHSLMICIDQSVIAEREKTLGESIDGMPLCGGAFGGVVPAPQYSRMKVCDQGSRIGRSIRWHKAPGPSLGRARR